MRPLATLAAAALLSSCASGGGGSGGIPGLTEPSGGAAGAPPVVIPGDISRRGREGLGPAAPATPLTAAETEARRQRSVAAADALWAQAEALEPRNPEGAGDLFHDLAEDHPESPRAAEAKFREGRAYYRAHEYAESIEALRRYMEIAPANPHLADVEALAYQSGVEYLASIHGFAGIFRSEAPGYEMLKFVPDTFPNGAYADDALLALGAAYRKEDDKDGWIHSVLAYKLLLLRYPDSPLTARAHLGLAEAYLARDQGDRWHGGYTNLDPREDLPSDLEQAQLRGEVKSAPAQALEQYEALLQEAQRRPGSASAEELAAAQRGAATARERMAAKDDRIAAWYGSRNGGAAARAYRASAADLRAGGAPGRALGEQAQPVAPPPETPPAPPATVPPSSPPAPPPAVPPVTPPPVAPPPVAPPPPVPPPTIPQPPTLSPLPPGGAGPVAGPAGPGTLPRPASRRIPAGSR